MREQRDTFKYMEALITEGYDVTPVNPNERDSLILGRLCYASLTKYKVPKYFYSRQFIRLQLEKCRN